MHRSRLGPFLDQFDFPAYAGNVMVPFEGQFAPRLEGAPARRAPGRGSRCRRPRAFPCNYDFVKPQCPELRTVSSDFRARAKGSASSDAAPGAAPVDLRQGGAVCLSLAWSTTRWDNGDMAT